MQSKDTIKNKWDIVWEKIDNRDGGTGRHKDMFICKYTCILPVYTHMLYMHVHI